MNICSTCQQCFEDAHSFCAYDQTPLVLSRPGSCLIGQKYRFDQLLFQDEMSAAYAGTLVETDRPVAITLLRPRLIAEEDVRVRFRREAHAIAHLNTRIDNQHVARTLDYGSLPDGGEAFIVTELIAGQTLREYMNEAGQLTLADALHIARQIVDGLGAAHRCGVVHRDLTPSNVILTRNYLKRFEVKIINFGITRLREQRPLLPASDGKRNHAALATLDAHTPYTSPEQRAGEEPDGRSDLYSLGVILYEMLAGQLPFTSGGANVEHTSASNREEQLLPLRDVRTDVPEPVAQLVMQSLQNKPSSRPYSADEFARQLRMDEHPATHIKHSATTATVASQAHAAPVRLNDAPASKAISTSDSVLPPAAASVLSLPVGNEKTARQQEAHAKREPDHQPQLATVFQDAVTPVSENNLEAQELNSAPRKIIIYFEDEAWNKDREAPAAPSAAAHKPFAEVIPAKAPSSTSARRGATVIRQTARRRFALASFAAVVVLALGSVFSWLAFDPSSFRPAASLAGSSDARTTIPTPTADVRPAEGQTALQVPAAQQTSSQAEAVAPSTGEGARTPRDETDSASSNGRANSAAISETTSGPSVDESAATQPDAPQTQEATERAALRAARDRWLAATNERDVEKQMSLYMPRVDAFYSSRNASRAAVRDHKARVYGGARSIEMRAGEPKITFDRNGRTATMRFRKTYLIRGRGGNNRGEAIQELRWTRTDDGWRIAGERNLSARETEETAELSRETRTGSAARGREHEARSSSTTTTRPRRAVEDSTRPRRVERTTTPTEAENSEPGARRRGKKG